MITGHISCGHPESGRDFVCVQASLLQCEVAKDIAPLRYCFESGYLQKQLGSQDTVRDRVIGSFISLGWGVLS